MFNEEAKEYCSNLLDRLETLLESQVIGSDSWVKAIESEVYKELISPLPNKDKAAVVKMTTECQDRECALVIMTTLPNLWDMLTLFALLGMMRVFNHDPTVIKQIMEQNYDNN